MTKLEKKLNSESAENAEVIIYFTDDSIPEGLLNDNVPHIFIPDNGRDPEFEPIQRERLKLAVELAGKRKKAQSLYYIN